MELEPREGVKSELIELVVPPGSPAAGRPIVSLSLPAGTLIILLAKGTEQFSPRGDTVIEEGDTLLILTSSDTAGLVREIIMGEKKEEPDDEEQEENGFPIDLLVRYR
jgi:Trk K+ transport system NAD-binding subunit